MNDNTWGCGLVAGMIVLVTVLLVGAPILSGAGLSWDNSAQLARLASRERTELARIAADERVQHDRIAQQEADGVRWHETLRWVVVAVAAGVALYYVRGMVWRWLDRRAQVKMLQLAMQAEVQLAALPILAARPGAHVETIDGVWWVVDDAAEELIALEHRLPG